MWDKTLWSKIVRFLISSFRKKIWLDFEPYVLEISDLKSEDLVVWVRTWPDLFSEERHAKSDNFPPYNLHSRLRRKKSGSKMLVLIGVCFDQHVWHLRHPLSMIFRVELKSELKTKGFLQKVVFCVENQRFSLRCSLPAFSHGYGLCICFHKYA